MGRKAEERARRKEKLLDKFEADKANFVAKVVEVSTPKIAQPVIEHLTPKMAPHLRRLAEVQKPKAVFDGSRFAYKVTWCKTRFDGEDEWTWGELRAYSPEELAVEIEPAFADFTQRTWAEIDSLNSGTGHKLHHAQEYERIVVEAQDRWKSLELMEFADSIFRFRIGATQRVWGYVVQAHFHAVWWDRNHKIHLYA